MTPTSEDTGLDHNGTLTKTFFTAVEQYETADPKCIINKLENILKNHPSYKVRVGSFRVLIDWEKNAAVLCVTDVFPRSLLYLDISR